MREEKSREGSGRAEVYEWRAGVSTCPVTALIKTYASNASERNCYSMPSGEKLMSHDLKTIVSDGNKAKFSHYRDGNFFYLVKVQDQTYSFPIPIEDAKGTTLFAEFKAITLMRWIRKAIEDKSFQLVKS